MGAIRRVAVLAGIIVAGLSLFGRPAAAQQQQVILNCEVELDWCEALKARFEAATGIKAAMTRKTDGETIAQLRAEASNPRVDVIHAVDTAASRQLAEEGLLEAYKSPRLAELADWAVRVAEQNKNYQMPLYTGVIGFGYNTELLAKKKMPEPKCWADLANPAYKDEVQMADPTTSGTAYTTIVTLLQLMGEDKGFAFLAQLHKNINQYTRSGSAGIKAAARGETTIGVAFLHDSVAQTVQGFPVKTVAPCEGTGFEVATVAIVKGARNLENAKKWVDWVLSPDGQNVAIEVNKFQLPSNKSAKVHPQAPRPENVKLLDYDLYKYASDETRAKMLARFEEIRKQPK
jgi:iron(III) transport system substrate-binding protein